MLSFDAEYAALREAGCTLPDDDKKGMEVMMVLFKLYLKGREAGINHAVRIVQRTAINPMPIVNEIRRPVR